METTATTTPPPGGAAAAPAKAITAKGASKSWEAVQTAGRKAFEAFLASNHYPKVAGLTAAALRKEHWLDAELYEHFAGWIAGGVVPPGRKGAGEPYQNGTIKGYVQILVNAAAAMHKGRGDPAADLFFTCLDVKASTPTAIWYRGLRKNIKRFCFERDKKAGDLGGEGAEPLYLEDVRRLVRAYYIKGTPEACARACAIIAAHQSAGRSSEIGYVDTDTASWDSYFRTMYAVQPMSKPSELKPFALCAGADRYCCFYAAFGYRAARVGFQVLDEDDTHYLFPDLHGSSAGAKLTKYVKDVCEGGLQRYSDVWVKLHDNPSAAGLRVGACNVLATSVPAEFATHNTGHSRNSESAYFEYLRSSHALVAPGAVVLAGFPPQPWGRLCMTPQPASLSALATIGVDVDLAAPFVDCVLRVDPATTGAGTERRGAFEMHRVAGVFLNTSAKFWQKFAGLDQARPRRDSSPRTIRVAAEWSRLVSTDYQRRRGRGGATRLRGLSSPRTRFGRRRETQPTRLVVRVLLVPNLHDANERRGAYVARGRTELADGVDGVQALLVGAALSRQRLRERLGVQLSLLVGVA